LHVILEVLPRNYHHTSSTHQTLFHRNKQRFHYSSDNFVAGLFSFTNKNKTDQLLLQYKLGNKQLQELATSLHTFNSQTHIKTHSPFTQLHSKCFFNKHLCFIKYVQLSMQPRLLSRTVTGNMTAAVIQKQNVFYFANRQQNVNTQLFVERGCESATAALYNKRHAK